MAAGRKLLEPAENRECRETVATIGRERCVVLTGGVELRGDRQRGLDEAGRLSPCRPYIALAIFGLFLSFYLLSAGGRPFSSDGLRYFQVAESLALRHTVAVPGVSNRPSDLRPRPSMRVGPDGRLYTKYYALGQSIVEAPVVLALKPAAEAFAADEEHRARVLRTWVPIATNAPLSAATVALTYVAVTQLGYGTAIGLAVSLLLGLSTMMWPYARWDFSEPLQGLLLLAAFVAVRRVRLESWSWATLGVGAALGGLILTKPVYAVVVPVFVLAVLWRVRQTRPRMVALALLRVGLPLGAGLVAYLAYNHVRSGSWLDFGYNATFNTPLLLGLYGWLFSSGKSIFLYCPVLIASALAAPLFLRKHPLEAAVAGAATALLVGTYAQFWAWHGDWGWGPRYATPLLPLLVLPLAPALSAGRKTWRVGVATLGIVGVFVQTLGVTIDPTTYLSVQLKQASGPQSGAPSLQDVHYIPSFSPLVGHWWLLTASLEQMASPAKEPGENRALQAFPWTHAEGRPYLRPQWRPPHPEYGLGIDLWLIRARPQSLKWTALLALGMAMPGAIVLVCLGAVVYRNARRRGRGYRPVGATDG